MEPRRSRTMEYDPVTGCYVRKVPLDFKDKKVEDIVREEMIKSERKAKSRSSDSAWKNPEDKERGSTPDTALVDLSLRASGQNGDKSLPYYVSGEGMETEYKFTVKEEIKTESKPSGLSKNGEFADEDIQKAGEAMKSKFDSDRSKFERDSEEVAMSETTKRSFERRRRSNEDPDFKKAREHTKQRTLSLDRRLKDMEKRRAGLFNEDKTEASEVTITKTVTTETSHSSTATEDTMLGERMQEAHRRHRNREERIRRRKGAEELISKKSPEGEDKPKSPSVKSAGVKLELRGSAIKKTEDSKSESEPHAFSGSSYSYYSQDDASDITFTVKNSATETKKEGDDKKEGTFDWNEKEQQSSSRTTETRNTSGSLMDEPIVWSQTGSNYPGSGGAESKRSVIKETEVKVVESKSVQSLFSSDFGRDEPQDIVRVKETSTSTKRTTLEDDKKDSDSSKSKPKELTLERGSYNDKYSFKSTSNSDLLKWEMDNVDSGKKASEPEAAQDTTDGYMDSLRRTNALGRVGSFKKGRDELPPAIFHDIESDAPGAPMIDIRTDTPPVSRDSTVDSGGQVPNLIKQLQDEDIDNERQRKRLEIEEKKRRIAESQKKANVQRRRDVSHSEKGGDGGSGSTDNIEDLSEKRRSLLMMWESYAEGEGPGPENRDLQEKPKGFGYEDMMREAAQSDPNTEVVDYRTMDVDDEKEETRTPLVDIDEYHKLNDDELKWERAGQFQPGKLKTKFHEMGKDEQTYEPKNTRKVMNNNTTDVTTKVFRGEQRFDYKVPVEEDQSYADENTEVESTPKQLWDDAEGQTTSKSDDEDDYDSRKPHVDVDEVHRMTEEEARWEKVGHFQPGKINTSVFETRKKADKSEPAGSPGIQRGEKSRYEQIKKIQRTDSKKELLVPKKVVLKTDRHEDFQEEDEPERPHVGKIEAPLFHGTESEDERQRREREARNRREMEEIQREREEERRRQERENLESKTGLNEFEDDEFDAKVKSKDVRKIDITKFGDFQKSSGATDVKPASRQSTKRIAESHREEKVTKTTYRREDDDYDIQFQQGDAAREKPVRKTSDKDSKRGYVQKDEIVVAQTTREVESAPDFGYEEDEYEIKRRSVGKLNKDWLSQAQEQEARDAELRRKESEMDRIKKEQYEIEQQRMEEKRRRENERDEFEVSRDESDLTSDKLTVKKLDSSTMSPFLKGGRPAPVSGGGPTRKKNKDEVRQERKLARKEGRTKMQTQETLYAQETGEVQQSPESFDDRPQEVGRLNTGKYLQMMGEDISDKERRKKLLEEERMKRELKEMERQREEDERRKEMDRDDTSSSSSSEKPQNVNKLDLAQFSQFQQQDRTAVPKKQPAKQITRETKKETRTEIIEKQTVDEVESEPFVPETSEREWLEKERSEALMYEEKRKSVGRLDVNRLIQTRTEEEQERQSKIKELERQRMITEREEMERLKAEKKGKKTTDIYFEVSSERSQKDNKAPLVKSSDSQRDREREEEWTVEEKRKSGVGRLNVDQFMQSLSKEEEEKNRRKLELEKERVRREAEERERLQMEQQVSSENIKVSSVQEVQSAPDDDHLYERGRREEREREEELTVEEKRKSVGRLDVNRFVQSINEEADEKRRRKIELEKERIRRENEEKELLRLEQEREHREPHLTSSQETSKKYVIVHRDTETSGEQGGEKKEKEKYSSLERERKDEMTVEEKRKSVGRLDFNQYLQSLSQEDEEKRRRRIELERERRRREEEEKELLRLEQERGRSDDVSRSTSSATSKSSYEKISRTVVQDVESSPYDQPDDAPQQPSRIDQEREEEMSVEEKRKSIGRLNVNQFFQSLNEEEEEKQRRRIELERERIKRENEERELLRMEQERSRNDRSVEQVSTSVVEEVHSAPPDDILFTEKDKRSSLERDREEAMSVEEKRKSVGRLDVNRFMQSISEEDREKQLRKIELERERLRREKEERELEEKQLRLRESSSYSEQIQIQSSSVQVVHSAAPIEYEDGPDESSQDQKEVGRLDLEKFSQQFNEEARERKRRVRELEIERLRLEREEMEGRGGSQTVEHESWSTERRETTVVEEKQKYRGDDVDRRSEGHTDSIKSDESSDSDKPVPKRLDLSKFSAFQSGSGKRQTKDDTAVKRREKSGAESKARPKSIAGSSFGGVANGDSRSGDRVYRIIH